MTISGSESTGSFAYTAQSFAGRPVSGTIDAPTVADASQQLAEMKLRVMRLEPTERPKRAKPLSGQDFAMFNQQLAYLSSASLPVEQGLRLIADDLRNQRLSESVRQVSAELQRGVPLAEAFKLHESQFPPLYGTLIEAGVRSGNLSGVLLNLGRHLELVARLREALWRAMAYPLAILAVLLGVMIFLGQFVLPQFAAIFRDFRTDLPVITRFALSLSSWTPAIVVVGLVVFVGFPLIWALLRAMRLDRAVADAAMFVPLVGGVLRRNLITRWCDAMGLAVQGGMDLPTAVHTACDIVGSPLLRRDCDKIIAQLNAGGDLSHVPGGLRVLPPTVLAVVQLSADRNDLPRSLETLAAMYRQQAEMRLGVVQTVLTPAMIILLGVLIAMVVLGMFAPMISLINAVSGS